MKLPPSKLDRYFAKHRGSAPYSLSSSDCESLAVRELVALEPDSLGEMLDLWLGYTDYNGGALLREQISRLYAGIRPDEILVHSGADEAIFNFMNATLVAGDHVIVHYPCYQSLFEVAKSIGCEVTYWTTHEEDAWELDVDLLRSELRPNTKAVIINSPHNPTGYLMRRAKLFEIAALSQAHGFIIFSDEVYRLLEYRAEDRLPAVCDIDERGVSLGVMSKTFGLAGLRIGWIATHNKAIYEQVASFKDYTTTCNSAPSEFLALLALRHKETLIERNLSIIRQNLSVLDQFFDTYAELFRWSPPQAGTVAFPRLVRGGCVERFCREVAHRTGVLLLPSTIYDPAYNNFRIGFGRANLPECLARLETYLREM